MTMGEELRAWLPAGGFGEELYVFDEVDSSTMAYLLNVGRRLAVFGNRQDMIEKADICMAAFLAIRQRHISLGKWGAAGAELVSLRLHVPDLADYFNAQPLHRLETARKWVMQANERMKAEGLLSADVREDGRMENGVRA